MVTTPYIPDKGDILWLNFNPQSGHEQKGKRPAIVLSPKEYNEKVGLALFCPIASKKKGYPFEVQIRGREIKGVALSDQIKSLDWKGREAVFIAKAAPKELNEIINKLTILIEDL
jgi:mRNA interferase MazF